MTYLAKVSLPNPVALFIVGLIFFGCQSDTGTKNIEDFYYPLDELKDGLVYEYAHPSFDSVAHFFNYYKTIEADGKVLFLGMQYNYLAEPQQLTVEEKVSNGMLLKESSLYQYDSTGRQFTIPVKVEVGSVFPFEVRDSGGIFVYNVIWHNPVDSSKFIRLIRNRRYTGDTTFVFEGQSHPAVKFNVREHVESFDDGFLEHEFNTLEIYAKGIGLVYYRKDITDDLTITYALKERFSMEVLEERLGKKLTQ